MAALHATIFGKKISSSHGGEAMKIWLPSVLYHAFPLFCVIIGFLIVMLMHNPAGIIMAAILYIYSFSVLWLRSSNETEEDA